MTMMVEIVDASELVRSFGHAHSAACTAHEPIVINSRVFIPQNTTDADERNAFVSKSLVNNAPKAAGEAWSVGDALYWDATGKPIAKSFGADAVKAHLATKYATPGDNPALAATADRVAGFFHSGINELDLGWTNLFQFVDMRQSNQTSFKVIGASTTMQFKQRAPGEKVEIARNIGSTDTPVEYVTYAAGLGVLDDWLRFQQFWNIEQTVAEFRGKYYDLQAELHYGLITALGSGIDVAYATDATVTFNAAAAAILRNMRASGYALGAGVQFTILTSPEKLGYVLKMLEATRGSQLVANTAGAQPIAYSVGQVVASP
jgi:hypothetical protein